MSEKKRKRKFQAIKPIIFIVLVITVIILVRKYNWTELLSLEYIKSQLLFLKDSLSQQPIAFALGYFAVYVLVTAFSIPGAAVLTLLGGALFGVLRGLVIISFASTFGATLSFLLARFFLREGIASRFQEQYKKVNAGLVKDGLFYLFALRLVPVFPFFIVNLVMGITRIPVLMYMVVSQVGMLPGTIIYINAGRALANVNSTSDIFSAQIWGAFALLALLPFISKKVVVALQTRKAYKGYTRPSSFDTNVVVIGAGSGGLVSAYIAALLKASVYLIEKGDMGGDCLNRGCVPSKALIAASKYASMHKKSKHFGIVMEPPEIVFSKVMGSVSHAIQTVAPHDSVERYEDLGVTCIKGVARILSPWEIEVGGRIINTKHIIIATGGDPIVPEITGLDKESILTSDNVWNTKNLPQHLLVVGGGPIGCEIAQSFARLGSKVTLVQKNIRLLPKDDIDAGKVVLESLKDDGVTVHLASHLKEVFKKDGEKYISIENEKENKIHIPYDKVFFGVGRKPNTSLLDDSKIEIERKETGAIVTNEYLQTSIPNIYAVGDVVGPHLFTHIASHMAWYATVNALFGRIKKFAVDYNIVPAVTFTSPEVAHVGINEEEAIAKKIEYEVVQYPLSESDRAIADQSTVGFVKFVVAYGKDKILGATIVGERAGEMLGEIILAMKHNIGLNKILSTIHPYPTYIEALKGGAAVWKRKHMPKKIFGILEKVFQIGLYKKNVSKESKKP